MNDSDVTKDIFILHTVCDPRTKNIFELRYNVRKNAYSINEYLDPEQASKYKLENGVTPKKLIVTSTELRDASAHSLITAIVNYMLFRRQMEGIEPTAEVPTSPRPQVDLDAQPVPDSTTKSVHFEAAVAAVEKANVNATPAAPEPVKTDTKSEPVSTPEVEKEPAQVETASPEASQEPSEPASSIMKQAESLIQAASAQRTSERVENINTFYQGIKFPYSAFTLKPAIIGEQEAHHLRVTYLGFPFFGVIKNLNEAFATASKKFAEIPNKVDLNDKNAMLNIAAQVFTFINMCMCNAENGIKVTDNDFEQWCPEQCSFLAKNIFDWMLNAGVIDQADDTKYTAHSSVLYQLKEYASNIVEQMTAEEAIHLTEFKFLPMRLSSLKFITPATSMQDLVDEPLSPSTAVMLGKAFNVLSKYRAFQLFADTPDDFSSNPAYKEGMVRKTYAIINPLVLYAMQRAEDITAELNKAKITRYEPKSRISARAINKANGSAKQLNMAKLMNNETIRIKNK